MSNSGAYNNNSKYDPAFCKQLLEHMSAGCSFATFGAIVGVRYTTLFAWRKQHDEWDEAAEIGELLLMYTWEKIIIGQANGSLRGAPATTIFALKNYFPDKFKENTALAGSGNTIVVFDSGVPVKTIETTAESIGDRHIEEAVTNQIEKPHNTVTNQVLPDFMINADIPVKSLDSQQNEADAYILDEDDI